MEYQKLWNRLSAKRSEDVVRVKVDFTGVPDVVIEEILTKNVNLLKDDKSREFSYSLLLSDHIPVFRCG